MPNIINSPSSNFNSRNGRKIIAIVDHCTDGLIPGCLQWLQNPISQASAHYVIGRDGNIYKLVNESDASWGAGVIDQCTWPLYDGTNPNKYVINLEHEGYLTQGGDGILTEIQYQSTLWLHRLLIAAYAIPIDNLHIIKHSEINANHNCPGPNFPWVRLFNDLNATVTIIANNTKIYGQIINGNTFAPISNVCKAKGWSCTWNGTKRTVCVNGASDANVPATTGTGVSIVVGNQVIVGEIIGNSAWCSIATVCKALGVVYTWDQVNKIMKF